MHYHKATASTTTPFLLPPLPPLPPPPPPPPPAVTHTKSLEFTAKRIGMNLKCIPARLHLYSRKKEEKKKRQPANALLQGDSPPSLLSPSLPPPSVPPSTPLRPLPPTRPLGRRQRSLGFTGRNLECIIAKIHPLPPPPFYHTHTTLPVWDRPTNPRACSAYLVRWRTGH